MTRRIRPARGSLPKIYLSSLQVKWKHPRYANLRCRWAGDFRGNKVRLEDPRIPAGAPVDANGLAINLMTALVFSDATAEGYFVGDTFYYFALEAEGPAETGSTAGRFNGVN